MATAASGHRSGHEGLEARDGAFRQALEKLESDPRSGDQVSLRHFALGWQANQYLLQLLRSYLIMPIQRIPRYVLLLQDYLKVCFF